VLFSVAILHPLLIKFGTTCNDTAGGYLYTEDLRNVVKCARLEIRREFWLGSL